MNVNVEPCVEDVSELRGAIRQAGALEEAAVVKSLCEVFSDSDAMRNRYTEAAGALVQICRERKKDHSILDLFLQEFGLSNQEGVALMCLAEALLRVPDSKTIDSLISEKIHSGDWALHKGHSHSVFVNAATWALMLTGKTIKLDSKIVKNTDDWLDSLIARTGEPIIRKAIKQAIYIMAREFVMGRTIKEGLSRAASNKDELYSFDMLGEGARTYADADRHFDAYMGAIEALGAKKAKNPYNSNGISIKLSALHPRYEAKKQPQVQEELFEKIKALALKAKEVDIHLTVDAEEAARLEFSLDLIEALAKDVDLRDWAGLGFALQCYSKRAVPVLDWVIAVAKAAERRFMIRFVKGAYWDAEIKIAQEKGLNGFPVFTRKCSTDLSYLVCAKKALAHQDYIFPQFATHNATTIAAVMEMAEEAENHDFEFQRLHGMGALLYKVARQKYEKFPRVRVYAPVGAHKDLLAYLVRRLLENGANSSFVNRFLDAREPLDTLVADPVAEVAKLEVIQHPGIAVPAALFGPNRRNAQGYDLDEPATIEQFSGIVSDYASTKWLAGPIVNGVMKEHGKKPVRNPANRANVVGYVMESYGDDVENAIQAACDSYKAWDAIGGAARADILEKAADLLEQRHGLLRAMLTREAGKNYADAEAEIREAVDFCRFYAEQARREFTGAKKLPGPTGEDNFYSLHGRGAFVCISPWNFPLAIFMGQVVAALAAGNAVLAKPADQTPIVAAEAVKILHESGVPGEVLHLLPGSGAMVGAALTVNPNIAGVAFTGSTATAKMIARTVASKEGPIIPLIAETGGQNAMFVDSTALPEQVVDDVIRSAFHSAGQRCSALRVLYLQADIADQVIGMIKGAMDALTVGNPADFATDVGPVIDEAAEGRLEDHIQDLKDRGCLLHRVKATEETDAGTFVYPHMFEIGSASELQQEHFGPILHVVRYKASELVACLDELEATGFGLTVGVHSRLYKTADTVFAHSLAGNAYINRNMVGAVVGSQPFGGQGLSGTGPKAGGPLYLYRFATERVRTVNTTATGGNAELLRL